MLASDKKTNNYFSAVLVCALLAVAAVPRATKAAPQFPRAEKELEIIRQRLAEMEAELKSEPADLTNSDGIKRQLKSMVGVDQYVRNLVMDTLSGKHDLGGDEETAYRTRLYEFLGEIDSPNTETLEKILDTRGGRWFTISVFGTESAHQAWLIAQHADRKPDFQRRVLAAMQALPKGEVDMKDLAFLTDRLAVKDGRPQEYGTQKECAEQRARLQNHEGTDLKVVDENRRRVGLSSLDESLREMEQYCRHTGAR